MSTLLSVLHRWTRRSEGHIFAFTPEQIGIIEGLRASVAIALFLVLDLWLSAPDLAFGAVAAFWTCLCDPGGPDRVRLRTMAEFAIGATLSMALAAYGAHWGSVAGGVTLFVLVALCGLTRSYRPTFGPMPTPIGLIMAIAVVVGVTSPRTAGAALHLGICFLSGAVWAMVLCLALWRTQPRAPARRAVAAIFARLEDMIADLLRLDLQQENRWAEFEGDHRRAVRLSIERGRESVARLTAGRAHFTHEIDAAGRIFAALMALGHYRAGSDPFSQTERSLLDRLRELLAEKQGPADDLRKDAANQPNFTARAVAAAAEALTDLARYRLEPETDEATVTSASKTTFQIPAPVWRQALRVATAVTISYTLGALYDLSFSYWGTIATLVLLQPLGANTWLRVVERAVGSVIGGILTAILIARLSGPFEMLLFIAPLCAAVIALRLVNYGLFMIFLTPMFVLVSDFIHPASGLIASRAINEAIGACIGLAGSLLLWPEKRDGGLPDAMLAALSANMAFAVGVLRSAPDLELLRREAGITSTRAEIARQRLRLQGRSAHLGRIHDILTALRGICGATNVLALMRQLEPALGEAGRAERYERLAGQLRQVFSGDQQLAVIEPNETDDLARAVRTLIAAIEAYAADATGA